MQRRTTTQWWVSMLVLSGACGDDKSMPLPAQPMGTMVAPTATPGAGTAGSSAPIAMPPAQATPAPTPTMGSATPMPTPGPTAGTMPMAMTPAGMMPAGGAPVSGDPGKSPANCEGFKLEGLMFSPGGSVLPNTCMPFDATTNNPYAVRCVDAWPWYKTEYPGDDFCILPPPPDKGVQFGVHPQGAKWFEQVSKGDMSGYAKLSDDWLMKDGEEESANYETRAGNMAKANYYRSYSRMRPGSHHMIVNSDQNKPADERWYPIVDGGLLDSAAGLLGAVSLPGAQRPNENRPPSLEKPSEDLGLFRELPANAKITYNMHHFNPLGKQILKEAWTNLWWETDAQKPIYPMRGLEVGQVLTMSIPAGATQNLHYSWNISQQVRLVEAFGHRHAWTTNFSSWIENRDGTTEIVYQSFDWMDEPTYRYDSVTTNPKPSQSGVTDGAHSGVRMLMPGQKLHFNCHIEFTAERAMAEKAPMPSTLGTLRFANEAFTGEMCILFGSTAIAPLDAPVVDNSPLPDFATRD